MCPYMHSHTHTASWNIKKQIERKAFSVHPVTAGFNITALHVCLSWSEQMDLKKFGRTWRKDLRFYCSVRTQISMSVDVFTSVTYRSHCDCPPLFKDDTLVTLDSTVQLHVVLLSIIWAGQSLQPARLYYRAANALSFLSIVRRTKSIKWLNRPFIAQQWKKCGSVCVCVCVLYIFIR